MRPALAAASLFAALAALVALTLWVLSLLFSAAKGSSGPAAEGWRLMFAPPYNLTRVFSGLILALLLVATLLAPVSWLETRALKAFARREEEWRRERPEDVVTPYDGAEGVGVAFDGPMGRRLLLHPAAGLGAPREIVIPPPPIVEEPSAALDERPSPTGSSP